MNLKRVIRRFRQLTQNTRDLRFGALLEGIRSRHPEFRWAPADKTDLASLEKYRLPDVLMTFYRESEPDLFEGPVRLWDIEHVVTENERMIPGCDVSKQGFCVVASTYCGDAICLDLGRLDEAGEPEIVHITHETDHSGKTTEEIRSESEQLCCSFSEFLQVLGSEWDTAFNWLDPVGRKDGWVKPNSLSELG